MKNKITFLIIVLLINISAFAQNNKEKAVAQSVENLKIAMINADKDALQRLTAKELSYGHSSGTIEDQGAFIDALVSGQSDFKTMDLTDQKITVVDKTAYVRHKLAADVVDKGKELKVNLGILLVWVEQGGQWKLLARQAYKL